MAIQVGYQGLGNLRKGQAVLYRAGQDDFRVEAKGYLTDNPDVSAMIRIDEITYQGNKAVVRVSEILVAGALELYLESELENEAFVQRELREHGLVHLLDNMRGAGMSNTEIEAVLVSLPDSPDKGHFLGQYLDSLPVDQRAEAEKRIYQ